MKILVVDDEQDICEILQYNLEMEGYEVVTAGSAEEALTLPLATFHLLLLDVMMGEMSGFTLARKLKDDAATAHIPIIFLTALGSEDDTVRGLHIGADDYIAKPLHIREVMARVAAVLRRAKPVGSSEPVAIPSATPPLVYEALHLMPETKTATLHDTPLALTRLEYELLQLFLTHTGQVFSRDELITRCWPQSVYVAPRTVDVSITRLRKKIAPYGVRLKTRFGYGYYFEK